MPAFFALNDLFGIKSLPETRVYWSKDNFVSVPTVQKVKPRNRFDKIRQYLSLNNRLYTQDDPGYVKLFKVRSLLDRLDSRIHEEYQPSKFISIDEWPSTKELGSKGEVKYGFVAMRQMVSLAPCKFTRAKKVAASPNTVSEIVMFPT